MVAYKTYSLHVTYNLEPFTLQGIPIVAIGFMIVIDVTCDCYNV